MFEGRRPLQKKKKEKKYTEKTTKENLIFMSLLDDGPLWDQLPWI